MIRLTLNSGLLPQALFLPDVKRDAADVVAQGSFSDIYRGRLGDSVIAIKRLRQFYIIKDTRSVSFYHFRIEHDVMIGIGIMPGVALMA